MAGLKLALVARVRSGEELFGRGVKDAVALLVTAVIADVADETQMAVLADVGNKVFRVEFYSKKCPVHGN